jgi:hypothetical protein
MEMKYNLGDAVHFLDFSRHEVRVNILCPSFDEFQSFDNFYHYGTVVGIHITEDGVCYDIEMYNCYCTPIDKVTQIPEYQISDCKSKLKRYFIGLIEDGLEKIKEHYTKE